MFKNKLLIIVGLLLFGGCSSGGDGGQAAICQPGDAPYIGCWITAGCQSMDNPVNAQSIWGTIRYEFTSTGNIKNNIKVYTNSSCAGSPIFQENNVLDLSFVDQGPEDLASSITAYRLTVQDIDVGAPSESEVLVHVTDNNRLCLSNNLLLNINGYSFFYNEIATAIDFNNCLEG